MAKFRDLGLQSNMYYLIDLCDSIEIRKWIPNKGVGRIIVVVGKDCCSFDFRNRDSYIKAVHDAYLWAWELYHGPSS